MGQPAAVSKSLMCLSGFVLSYVIRDNNFKMQKCTCKHQCYFFYYYLLFLQLSKEKQVMLPFCMER